MRTILLSLFCFLSFTCFAQSTVGDTLSFQYVRTLQNVSDQTYYYDGKTIDLLLTRTGATVTIVKISEDGIFTVGYMESFMFEDEAIFIFGGKREMMLPATK